MKHVLSNPDMNHMTERTDHYVDARLKRRTKDYVANLDPRDGLLFTQTITLVLITTIHYFTETFKAKIASSI